MLSVGFPLLLFNICPLCLIFVNLINMCLGVFHLGFILFETLCVSWTWVIISSPLIWKFSTIISSCIFSLSFFLSSSSETPMIQMLECLTLSQRSLRLSSFLLICFSFFISVSFISTILSSTSLILSSASVILLLVPSRVFLISFIALFASLVAQMVKRLPTMWETQVQILGWEDLLGKEMVTHSSILAWKIPWTVEPDRLHSMGSQRVGHD